MSQKAKTHAGWIVKVGGVPIIAFRYPVPGEPFALEGMHERQYSERCIAVLGATKPYEWPEAQRVSAQYVASVMQGTVEAA